MTENKVAVLDDWDNLVADAPALNRLRAVADVKVFHESLPSEDLVHHLKSFHAVLAIRERTRFDADLLRQLPQLRHIAQTGAGVAHLDIKAATERGVSVSVTPGGSASAVAEVTMGLMLSVVHRLAEGDAAIRRGEWPRLIGGELYGKTLGLIGLGAIGQQVAKRAQAFGLRLLAWSANLTAEVAAQHGAELATLDQLLPSSHIVSLHLRLSDRTRGLLNLGRLRAAKPGLILINTARAELVPEADLLAALGEGTLGGAGLDVFAAEPLPAGHPLSRMSNVVLTPHLGWTTRETFSRFVEGAVDNLHAYFKGEPSNIINPEALQTR